MEQNRSKSRRDVASKRRRIVPAIRRSPKGDATQRRILDAAMFVVAAEGYHAATHQRIAQAAGLVRTAINYHFPDQDALSEALVTHLHRLKMERVAAVIGASPRDDREHAGSTIEAYWSLLQETPFVALADLECCARTDPALRARLAAARDCPGGGGAAPQPRQATPVLDHAPRPDLSVYLLECLARGGLRRDGLLLDRRLLRLLKLAAEAPADDATCPPNPIGV